MVIRKSDGYGGEGGTQRGQEEDSGASVDWWNEKWREKKEQKKTQMINFFFSVSPLNQKFCRTKAEAVVSASVANLDIESNNKKIVGWI